MPNESNRLPHRRLGRTGLTVTQLGYGSMGIRGPKTWGVRVVSDEQAEQILNSVLDAGINFIDTSPDYGISEERIGRFISQRRSEFVLATKCGCDYTQHEEHLEINHRWETDVIRRNIETSLKRLQTDSIDLLQFHGGDATVLKEQGLIELLLDYQAQGIIRFLGVSTKVPDVAALIDLGVFDTFQMPYSCLANEHDAWLRRAATAGAGIVVRGGIAHGGPDAEIQRPQLNQVWEQAKLDEVLPDGMSRAELLLRCTLSHPNCDTVIVGTCNPQHLQENLQYAKRGALDPALVNEVVSRVTAAHRNR